MDSSELINGIIQDVEKYEFKTSKGSVTVAFVEAEDKLKFLIRGPKEFIAKAIGGTGDESETEAWATEVELDTEAKRIFAILEVLKNSQK